MKVDIEKNIQFIKENVFEALKRSNRASTDVEIIAVSKNHSVASIVRAFDSGISTFGENYVQEAVVKIPEVKKIRPNAKFHFIGHLQSNKINQIVPLIDCLQTVDTLKLAQKIDNFINANRLRKLDVFFQINISKEINKSGFDSLYFLDILNNLRELRNLNPIGLMMIGGNSLDLTNKRKEFAELRMLRDTVCGLGFSIPQISMGMTDDYEIAIEEHSSIVRIGSGIFGERQY